MQISKSDGGAGPQPRRALPPLSVIPTTEGRGIPGALVLDEIEGELGYLLWLTLRSVLLWVEAPVTARTDLFVENSGDKRLARVNAAGVPDELASPLSRLARLLEVPAQAEPYEVARACERVADWAVAERHARTALEFVQAAARCCPAEPRLSLAAGRMARELALYPIAQAWLYRTILLARPQEDWVHYARAYLSLGALMRQRGAYPAARRFLLRACRHAERHGLREVWGMALHDLFVLETEAGREEPAEQYAIAAFEAYGPGHPLLVNLTYDVGFFWLLRGVFGPALALFEALLPRVEPRFRPHIYGGMARAAGAIQDVPAFTSARAALAAVPAGVGVAEAWNDVGHGALSLGRWRDAYNAASRALALASARGEARQCHVAESLIDCSARTQRACGDAATPGRQRPPADTARILRQLQTVRAASG
jgi:tetratricopeptide (TPR) repeat protein